ncbi:MAG: c-type cytochrome [Thalassovita sp.]|nr:c-type cytochrome [Thalassovita sp.]
MRYEFGLLAAGAGVLGLVGWFVSQDKAQATGLLPYTDPVAVAAGRDIYTEYCAACHGADLEGEPNWREQDAEGYLPAPPHDPSGHTWHHPDEQLFLITKYGTEALVGNGYRSRMQGFGDVLDVQDILNVLAYIKSTWPGPVAESHNQRNIQAAQN